MNCLVWNCRGAGGRFFPSLIRDYIKIYHIDFIAILETRISGIKAEKVIKKIGMDKCAKVEAIGFSGGIWCLWKSSCPPITVIASSRYCIHLKVNGNAPSAWYLSIIYASPQLGHREETWEELRQFKDSINLPWCLAGDFNTVLFSHEKDGGAPVNQASSTAFMNCINDCNLVDLGYSGPEFTWSRGNLRERLDRVLSNTAWHALFPNSTVTHLSLSSSDHCGLWLRLNNDLNSSEVTQNFKFLSPWLEHPEFKNQVISTWRDSSQWADNIQRMASNLSIWNKEVFGNIFKRKQRILRRLEVINRKLLEGNNDRLTILKQNLWTEYNTIIKDEEAYWLHHSKSKWISLGDCNTRFFHQAAIQRRRRNRISALLNEDGQWVYEDSDLYDLVLHFYKNLYTSLNYTPPPFHTVTSFPPIKDHDLYFLSKEVDIEETRKALFSMGNLKSPGPYGFHPVFFKSQWEVVGPSLHHFVQQCFLSPENIKEVNHTLITLIPKCEDPTLVS
jgi:hypothetical protein